MKKTCLINTREDEKGIAGQARNDRYLHMKNRIKRFFLINKYIILIIVFMLYACSKQQKEQGNNLKFTIKAETSNLSSLDLSKISTFHSIIPLETSEDCLIGKIEKVFILDSTLVVWDSKSNNILVFDLEGRFKHNISKKGAAPQEYVRIYDLYAYNDTIQILDTGSRHILVYDVQGDFIASRKLEFYLYSFLPVSAGYWGLNYYQNEKRYNLILLDKESGKIVNGYFPCKNNLPIVPCNSFVINEITNESFFYYPYNDTIYQINKNELKPYIHVDFGAKRRSLSDMASDNFNEKMRNSDFLGSLNSVYMHGDILFFSFSQHYSGDAKIDIYHCFISLKDLNPIVYTIDIQYSSELPIQPLPEIIGLSSNKLIFQIVPGILPEKVFEKLKHTKYENSMTPDSNPVLVLYEFL
jgi:hypothetical protein